MAERGWPSNTVGIGVFEFRRSARAIWRDKARFALMALGVLFPTVVIAGFAVVFSDTIQGVETVPDPALFRGWLALFWLFAVFMIGQRVVSTRPRIDAEALMLTTVSPRTVAGGMAIAETLRILAYLGAPVLVLTGVAATLFASPASLLAVPLAAACFTATAVVIAGVLGYAIAWLVATSRFVARHRTVLGTAVSIVGMGLYFVFFFPQVTGITPELLAPVPVGWVFDLALVGTGLGDTPLRALAALVTSLGLLVGGGMAIERETAALWFTDPVSPDASPVSTRRVGERDAQGDPLASAVSPLVIPVPVSTPVRRVAQWVLLRTRRDPNRLTFLLLPVVVVASPVVSGGVQSGSIGRIAAPALVVGLPWLAGALFALNPLGDEGAVLPVTLTAVSGSQYVRGLVLPGLLYGLPTVLGLTALAGVLSPYSLVQQATLIALGGYLTCVAVTITPAVGMALPRFSAISVGQSRDVLPPRMLATAVHAGLTVVPGGILVALVVAPGGARAALAGVVGGLPALVLQLLARSDDGPMVAASESLLAVGQSIQSIGLEPFRIVGGGLLVLGGVCVAVLLYRNAIGRFERYSPS